MNLDYSMLCEQLKRDGLVFVPGAIPEVEAAKIKSDIQKAIDKDISERKRDNLPMGRYEGSYGVSHNNIGKHILTDFFAKSSTLDQQVESLLQDENIANLLEFIGGKNLKLRGYNTRRMNGPLDYSAMEWHRDNRGEITIGIVLSESGNDSDSATCYIPGSHLYPYCPFQSAQFTMPVPTPPRPKWQRYFSAKLEEKTLKLAKDAKGKPGDVYIFIGDLWHGRRPNFVGNHDMVFFLGLFPSEIPFPSHSEVVIPPEETLSKLPKKLRTLVDYTNMPANTGKESYFYHIHKDKVKPSLFSLWTLTRFETIFWKMPFLGGNSMVQKILSKLYRLLYKGVHSLRKIKSKLIRAS